MSEFHYQALDRTGKAISGVLQASDLSEVVARIREMGYFPLEVAAQPPSSGNGRGASPAGQRISLRQGKRRMSRLEVAVFTRQLSDMLGAGLVVDRAFSVLIEQAPHPKAQEVFTGIQNELRYGKPLSEALESSPQGFPPLYINMVRAGEVSGQLDSVLARLADFLEKEHMRRSQVISALSYPAILITVAVVAVTFLLTFVIPRLQSVFKEMGSALPLPTVILLSVSGLIGRYWWALGLGAAVLLYGLYRYIQTATGRRIYDRVRLEMAVLGPILRRWSPRASPGRWGRF